MSSTNSTITDIELLKSYVRTRLIDTMNPAPSIRPDEPDENSSEIRPQRILSNNLRNRKLRKADLEMFSKTQTVSTASIL